MILVIIGTRPEAIKLAPLIIQLRKHEQAVTVLLTNQQSELAKAALACFSLEADIVIRSQFDDYEMSSIASSLISEIGAEIRNLQPLMTVVQGDTTSAFAGAIASFYEQVPIAHVEAGLRTHDMRNPFPEEMHRKAISALSSLHFTPGEAAKASLLKEGVSEGSIYVTGNTVIDALRFHLDQKTAQDALKDIDLSLPYVLVTAHRRENFGALHRQYFAHINAIAKQHPDYNILYITHTNPHVSDIAESELTAKNVTSLAPLDYGNFVHLLKGAYCIVTDSGGIQEESAYLGVPTIVMRANTERCELMSGANILMAHDPEQFQHAFAKMLSDSALRARYAVGTSPYGEGCAAEKISHHIQQWLHSDSLY